jgi:hypothetical protein
MNDTQSLVFHALAIRSDLAFIKEVLLNQTPLPPQAAADMQRRLNQIESRVERIEKRLRIDQSA